MHFPCFPFYFFILFLLQERNVIFCFPFGCVHLKAAKQSLRVLPMHENTNSTRRQCYSVAYGCRIQLQEMNIFGFNSARDGGEDVGGGGRKSGVTDRSNMAKCIGTTIIDFDNTRMLSNSVDFRRIQIQFDYPTNMCVYCSQ